MKPQQTDDRVRPEFVALLGFGAAALLFIAWALTRSAPPAELSPHKKAPAPVAHPASTRSRESSRVNSDAPAPFEPAQLPAATPEPAPTNTQTLPSAAPASLIFTPHMAPVPQRSAAARQEKLRQVVGESNLTSAGSTLETRWGIQVRSLGLSMGNAMLDLRYKVVDPQKAVSLVNGNTRAFVFDPETGATIFMPSPPKEGAFPPSGNRLSAGKTYFAAVANPRGTFKSGNKVSLVIGDCVLADLEIK